MSRGLGNAPVRTLAANTVPTPQDEREEAGGCAASCALVALLAGFGLLALARRPKLAGRTRKNALRIMFGTAIKWSATTVIAVALGVTLPLAANKPAALAQLVLAQSALAQSALAQSALAQSADQVLCDRIAADPADPDKPADVKGAVEIAASDIATAIKFCKRASTSSRRALYELGRAYAANRQMTEATGAYRKAADKGSSAAMVELGSLLANGSAGPKDETQARTLFARAAAAGNARGAANLATLSGSNGDNSSDPAEARAMLAKAAETNSAEAQFQLALMMANGVGGPKDDIAARERLEDFGEDFSENSGIPDANRQNARSGANPKNSNENEGPDQLRNRPHSVEQQSRGHKRDPASSPRLIAPGCGDPWGSG